MSKALVIPAGTVFGRLTVVGEAEPYVSPKGVRIRKLQCKCSCGNVAEVALCNLRTGCATSCGCYHSDVTKARNTKHGEAQRGHVGYLYLTWYSIKQRCYNSASDDYQSYGGRGIKLYAPWVDNYVEFANYIRTVLGERPNKYSLDRLDFDKGYEPGNLRWATDNQQARNRRNNVSIEFQGRKASVAEWAEETGIKYATLRKRLNDLKWPVEKALTTPLHRAAE